MGQWRANDALYGPGGGEWVDPAGTVTPDPWGTLNPQKAAAAQIAAAAKASEKSVWDYIIPIIGAGATVATAGLAGSK